MAAHVGSISSAMAFDSMRDLLPGTIPEEPEFLAEEDLVITAAILASDPVIIKKTDEEIEFIAKDILENKMKKFRCAFDILPQIVKLEDLRPNLEQNYAEYGHKLLNYLQYHIHLELMRTILKLAATRQLKDLRDPSTSGLIAIARGEREEKQEASGKEKYRKAVDKREDREAAGEGEDREAAVYAASQCALKRIPTICVTIMDGMNSTSLPKKPVCVKEHTFLLLGIERNEFELLQTKYQSKIRVILKHLQHGVLFDPSLKLICPLNQIDIRGRKLLQYIKIRGIETVRYTFTKSYDEWQEILVGADRCSRAMTGELFASELALGLASKAEKVREWVMSDIKKELNRLFPKLIWSMDVSQEKIWIEGNAQVVIQAQNNLRELGIRTNIITERSKKSKKQIQRRCVVSDANLTQLRQLSSTSSSSTSTSHNSTLRTFISPSASMSVPTLSYHSPSVLSLTQASTSSRIFVPALVLTPPQVSDFRVSTSCQIAPLNPDSAPIIPPENKEGKGIV